MNRASLAGRIWYETAVPVFLERYLLPLAAALTVLVVFTNPMNFDWTQRITGGLTIVFAAYFVAHTADRLNNPKVAIAKTSITEGGAAPTILVRYAQSELPISIPARSTALVLQLTPNIQYQTQEIFNRTDQKMWWPTGRPRDPQKEPIVGSIYICELSNNSDTAFLDVNMWFNLGFFSTEPARASVKQNPDGTNSISVTMDTTRKDDPMAFAFVDYKKRVIAGLSGKLVSEHKHEVTIPVIAAHSTATLYFVPQSVFFTKFSLPDTATLIVDGNTTKRVAALIRPAMNPLDKLGKWGLQPSVYKWPDVPESTLDFDKFVALN